MSTLFGNIVKYLNNKTKQRRIISWKMLKTENQ